MMKKHLPFKKLLLCAFALSGLLSTKAQVLTQTFTFSGSLQTFTVPSCVNSMTVQLMGAQGASQSPGGTGGMGGYVSGVLTVTPGQVVNIYVGGQNGYNGGGTGGVNGNAVGGGPTLGLSGVGGGASDIRIGGIALTDRKMVAGGGGGAGHNGTWTGCQTAGPAGNGGLGGGLIGGTGAMGSSTACNCTGGGGNGGAGGTSGAGGAAGTYNGAGCLQGWGAGSAGTLGNGGSGSLVYYNGSGGSGGGGGGYYGGGTGANGSDTTPGGGGGGGSSFTGSATNTVNTQGTQSGNGQVIISYVTGGGLAITPSSTTICLGSTVTLLGGGALTYTWSNGSNASSIAVTPTANATYTAQGTTSLGCVASAIATVNVNNSPTVSVAGSTLICGSGSVVLTASGANTYSWNNGAATASISVSPSVTTNYTVIGTSTLAGNCSGTSTVAIIVSAIPTVAITGGGTICAGNATVLTGGGASSYSWNTGATTSTISVSPTVNTTYTAVGTNTAGCSNTATASIVVSPCTGINQFEVQGAEFKVYPNPSNGEFTVELKNGLTKTIEVTDLSGRVILSNTTSKDKVNISISHLANGIYYVKVQSNNAVEVMKIVKQ